jgi:2-haloacid dehalogenase
LEGASRRRINFGWRAVLGRAQTFRECMLPVAAVVFDAYGTLFNVHSVAKRAEELFPGQGSAISGLWRTRQIDYTRIRTLSRRYLPFSQVTADALDYAFEALKLSDPDGSARQELMDCYARLELFPENREALSVLEARKVPLAILSNGDATMLATVLGNAGIAHYFSEVLSADEVGSYKTAPEVYALTEAAFRVPAKDMVFVSSNCWDACGASWYGFQTFWVNRTGEPLEVLGVKPDMTADTMRPLTDFVDAAMATA